MERNALAASTDEALTDQPTILGLADTRFSKKIHQSLSDRTRTESIASALFYINLFTFLSISLAANGLSVAATAAYLSAAYACVLVAFIMQSSTMRDWLKSRRVNNVIFYSLIELLEDSTIIIALYFNATASQQVSPTVAIVCICAATFLSLPVSTRLFASFCVSKCAIFLACIIYITGFGDDDAHNINLVFPLIITFMFIFSLGYWLYLRQVKLLHQKHEQEELRNIIHDKNVALHAAISAERATNAELSRAHTLREKIIRHIGHDLRQPINALNYSLFNIDKSTLRPDQQLNIDIAAKSVETANYLIEEVLQLATYKKTEIAANPEAFKISTLFRIIEREYSVAAQQAGCQLRVVNSDLHIVSDYQLVSRIVKNFLSNAIRHTKGSAILLGVRRRKTHLEIQVIDTGPGIPLNIRDSLFEEFVIGENAKSKESFGLGLSITKHLARVCEGDVSIASTINKGTRCSLILPYTID